MGHAHLEELTEERFVFSSKAKMFTIILAVLGLILMGIGVAGLGGDNHDEATASSHDTELVADSHGAADAHATEGEHAEEAPAAEGHGEHHQSKWARLWANLLLNSYYFLIIAVIGVFFVGLQYIANAGWATGLLRVPTAMSMFIPIALVLLLVTILFGKEDIYHHWILDGLTDPEAANYDPIIAGKSAFLNETWLTLGVFLIGLIWFAYAWYIRKNSIKEDEEGALPGNKLKFWKKNITLGATFTVIFAFSFSILSWLIVMSIDAHWFSTIFSIYNFAVAFVSGLTVICFFTLYLKSKGYLYFINDEHLHDLGKFMFAFCIFWGYIWVSQFLLIWYANLPEESIYFFTRAYTPGWEPWFIINVLMCFAAPFLLLMTRNSKRSPFWLILAGTIILVGHWIDMYLMIMPGSLGLAAPQIGALEIGTTMLFAGMFIYVVLWSLTKANTFPKNHPYIQEAVHHDVGV